MQTEISRMQDDLKDARDQLQAKLDDDEVAWNRVLFG